MTAYASYCNPNVHNNKDITKTREQSAHKAHQHNYLGVDKKPIALDVLTMVLHH